MRRTARPGPGEEPEADADPPQIHQQVADLLDGPGPVRVRGDPEDMHVAGAYLHDEQAVQPLQGDRQSTWKKSVASIVRPECAGTSATSCRCSVAVRVGRQAEYEHNQKAADGTPRAALTGHDGEIRAVAVSSDGTRLATVGGDSTARIWTVPPADDAGTAIRVDGDIWVCAWLQKARICSLEATGVSTGSCLAARHSDSDRASWASDVGHQASRRTACRHRRRCADSEAVA